MIIIILPFYNHYSFDSTDLYCFDCISSVVYSLLWLPATMAESPNRAHVAQNTLKVVGQKEYYYLLVL
jgi:hypothetical protein